MPSPEGTPARPFYVREVGRTTFVVRMVECDGLGDAGFLMKPPGKPGWTCAEHAQVFADKLNVRYIYDAGVGA